jgi:hypothetical protein
MDSASKQVEQGSSFFLYSGKGDGGFLIKAEDSFVT